MRKLFTYLILLLPLFSLGQTEFDAVRVYDSLRVDGESRYGSDLFPYSSDRVFVDYGTLKGYVDTVATGGSSLTFTNGLTESLGTVKWGGTVSDFFTQLTGTGGFLDFSNFGNISFTAAPFGGGANIVGGGGTVSITNNTEPASTIEIIRDDVGLRWNQNGVFFDDNRISGVRRGFQYDDPSNITEITLSLIPPLGLVMDSIYANSGGGNTYTGGNGIDIDGSNVISLGDLSGNVGIDGSNIYDWEFNNLNSFTMQGDNSFSITYPSYTFNQGTFTIDISSNNFSINAGDIIGTAASEVMFKSGLNTSHTDWTDAVGFYLDFNGLAYFRDNRTSGQNGLVLFNPNDITFSDSSFITKGYADANYSGGGSGVSESRLQEAVDSVLQGDRAFEKIVLEQNSVFFSSTPNISFLNYSVRYMEVTGSTTITISDLPFGTSKLYLKQDATGSREIFTTSSWGQRGNSTGSINTSANGVTIVQFEKTPWGTAYFLSSVDF